jgi:hypothetical protein
LSIPPRIEAATDKPARLEKPSNRIVDDNTEEHATVEKKVVDFAVPRG